MRVGPQPIIARPAWYDRNPTTLVDSFTGSAAPHAPTTRISYTVPAGKKAIVETLAAKVIRMAAASTPELVTAQFLLTPSGGEERVLLGAYLTSAQNSPKDSDSLGIGPSLTLFPGDYIRGITFDLSTGGLVYYVLILKLTVFDA